MKSKKEKVKLRDGTFIDVKIGVPIPEPLIKRGAKKRTSK